MKRFLRIVAWTVGLLFATAILLIGLVGYFLYSPEPAKPQLSGALTKSSLFFAGIERRYLSYVPKDLPPGAPVLLVMHGSGQNGAAIRIETGYGFDRLADRNGFAVIYPDAVDGTWNSCAVIDTAELDSRGIDDVAFLSALADRVAGDIGIAPRHVFAAGLSDGGYMALRLAWEAPTRFRAVAPVAANLPAADNFKCRPDPKGGASIMLIHGTKDRLVPFDGGEGSLIFGFFPSGNLISVRDTARRFVDINGITEAPEVTRAFSADGFPLERSLWRNGSGAEVSLLVIEGAGHVFPQPFHRALRILGASPTDPDAAAEIWAFFERQQP